MSVFFEGSEKKLEVCIKSSSKSLRSYGRSAWAGVVEKSRAEILSEISNDKMDAYLLSESSLFVSDDRLIMITCGKTTLAHALIGVLEFVPKEDIEFVMYERKREIFPEYQRSNFYQDVKLIKEHFNGDAFRFGDEDDHHIYLFAAMESSFQPDRDDTTIEILMHGIDREAAQIFEVGEGHNESSVEKSGVRNLLPGFKVDDYIFEPQGYSLNAIKGESYYTIHVTPQDIGSYVSFETNAVVEDMSELVKNVLDVFRPSSCDILFFQPSERNQKIVCDYSLKKQVQQNLQGYDIRYNHYYKKQVEAVRADKLDI
ncbi:MAG: adenosylmethionine decarboxylase [Bdellovibrionales bacterium]